MTWEKKHDVLIIISVIAILTCAIMFPIYWAYEAQMKIESEMAIVHQKYGYSKQDVKIYLKYHRIRGQDFLNSPSVRKHYELWREGKAGQLGRYR